MDDDDDDDDYSTLFNNCNWSELHEDILELILKEFSTVEDCLRFGSVCVSWRCLVVPHLHPDLLNPQLPLLMIPSLPWPQCPPPPLQITPPPPPPPPPNNKLHKFKKEEEEVQRRSFYNVFEKRVCHDLHIKLPYNMYCRGSSHGWIIASGNESNGFCVELFNPFISINNEYQKIQLPPLTAFPYDPDTYLGNGYHFLEKAILTANPSTTKNYVVMVIYSGLGKLGFWKPGDQVWTDVPIGWKVDGPEYVEDIIYDHNNGVFYFVNYSGELMVFDLNSNVDDHQPSKVTRLAPWPFPSGCGAAKRYIVQSEGNLLMVHRFNSKDESETTNSFRVLKFHEEKNEEAVHMDKLVNGFITPDWEVINTLPGRMLFMGDNASMSFAASEFPGGKSSCIYFTDDLLGGRIRGYLRMGIFNMEDMTIEMLHPMESDKYMSPANTIWVEPTLKCCLHF